MKISILALGLLATASKAIRYVSVNELKFLGWSSNCFANGIKFKDSFEAGLNTDLQTTMTLADLSFVNVRNSPNYVHAYCKVPPPSTGQARTNHINWRRHNNISRVLFKCRSTSSGYEWIEKSRVEDRPTCPPASTDWLTYYCSAPCANGYGQWGYGPCETENCRKCYSGYSLDSDTNTCVLD